MPSLSIREQQEERERCFLSPHALPSAESEGRDRPEEKCPIRTEFQRDRDRIVHSKAFRRLKDKTQVFIDPEGDHYRTRLTHTLEVSQIARTVARALRLNEDLTEAIALGHDLGHTPFGHAGERALSEAYAEFVPGEYFAHSEQSLRVVEYLENDGAGLNLTKEVRDGILSHSKGREDVDLEAGGPGKTLEARVVRISDRIAYTNHDVDDAIRAGVIEAADLPPECVRLLGNRQSERIASMVIDLVESSRDMPDLKMSPEILGAMNLLKDFLFARVYGPAASGPRAEELQSAARMIRRLFSFYMEHTDMLPGWRRAELVTREGRARVACDFIAGMTDGYAQRQYDRIVAADGSVWPQ